MKAMVMGHRNIQHTTKYTDLAPSRFRNFWKDCDPPLPSHYPCYPTKPLAERLFHFRLTSCTGAAFTRGKAPAAPTAGHLLAEHSLLLAGEVLSAEHMDPQAIVVPWTSGVPSMPALPRH
jgi:hypothetical protein